MAENNKNNNYKVVITTAGLGDRLGDLTEYTNKSLARIGQKPAISYIIESYPKEIPIVISIGHFAKHVKDFVTLAYPDRKIEFTEVDNYEGPGSSMGYSLLQAKDKLQCPFVYHAGDTIVYDDIPQPDKDWVAGFKSDDTSHYASLNIASGKLVNIQARGATNFDYIHIGLVGINNYKLFWEILEKLYQQDRSDSSLNDVSVINEMIDKHSSVFHFLPFQTWFDTGNVKALKQARQHIKDHKKEASVAFLDKNDEAIFLFDKYVIKFFADEKNIADRIIRAKVLNRLVPEVDKVTENFYRYKYVDGDVYSQVVDPSDLLKFLDWAEENLWQKVQEVEPNKFREICHQFYYKKTIERIEKLQEIEHIKDKSDTINGEDVPSLKELLAKIDFDWLSDAEQYQFHGDFVLDNIIKTKKDYCLLDWRQNFGGLHKAGDKYYDLAKLNHNLVVNHDIIKSDLYSIKFSEDDSIFCDIHRKNNLVDCQTTLNNFLRTKGYDIKKVKMLSSLIWLNSSPLHHHPYNLFLYYFGKLNLWRILKNK